MNVTSLTVNITSLSLILTSDNSPSPSGPTPTVGANASQDRVSLSSLLSNLQNVSADIAQQGAGNGTISLNALTYDFRQAFRSYASNGQPTQGHHHHHGHHQAAQSATQAPSLKVSDVQHALDQLTTTLQQQADSDGTISKATVRQDVDQLFSALRGQSDTSTSTLQTVV
ncbi:MAG TPA: hypothetical protein VJV04_01950 [Nitrospiraceae bacterium]|nr:hypothetical protein [Nitrospiraceae bacterium]